MTEDYEVATDPIPNDQETRPEVPPPRSRSVRRPARGRDRTGRKTASAARQRASKTKTPARMEPVDAIRGLLQLPAAGFILVGTRFQSVPLMADGATIIVHGGPFAEAIAKICENDPRAMALLEKAIAFGPYGEALALALPIAAQFIRNHNENTGPVLEGFGAVSAEEIIAAAELSVPVEISPNGDRTSGNPTES